MTKTIPRVFNRLPDCPPDKTAMHVAYLRRLGWGIKTLKGGYYELMYQPDDTDLNGVSMPDRVYRYLLDHEAHSVKEIAQNTGMTRHYVTDAVCVLRKRGINIVTGGRGPTLWYQLYRVRG